MFRTHETAQQSIAHAKAVTEELELRSGEIARNMYEFNRDVVNGAISEVTACLHHGWISCFPLTSVVLRKLFHRCFVEVYCH